ncbi:SDR family NAD(P)-dependent oxidoreductase [Streptomyces sp. NBC_01497]|uniref:SDR family NAD(P)-dependent oxidoreductase n=1 Tax=Streptomyces sp. NBC_01497 TaxID=2903885 RepID=UPI002E2F5FF0|nr:SDR family NAD(P)-dependent oxidoreductase [Streptomyces sp. NBC_01497]
MATRAGRGIGRATALALSDAGTPSILAARSEAELRQTTELVKARGAKALDIVADLTNPIAPAHAVEKAVSGFGPIDILVNNAATVDPLGPSQSLDPTVWAAALGVDVIAPASPALALPLNMIKASWWRIVNVSSSIAANPRAMIGGNAYATTKGGLEAHN